MIPLFPIVAADDGVKAILGSDPVRFYPFSSAPQDGAFPYAVWGITDGDPYNDLSGVAAADHYSVTVNIYGDSVDSTRQAAQALRKALEVDIRITLTSWGLEGREPQTGLYAISFDFDFIHNRS